MANLSDKIAAGASITEVSTAVDYTIVATGNVRVYVDTTSDPVDITLPAGTAGQEIEIIDAGENAGTNIITIVGTIDGATNATIEADSASRKIVYSGTAWETTGGVDQFFTRNAATGVISCKQPDAFSADRIDAGDSGTVFGGAGVSDFSNAEANVTQGVSAWSNKNEANADPFNNGGYNTDATTPYVVTESASIYAGWNAFDNATSSLATDSWFATSSLNAWLKIDLGVGNEKEFVAFLYNGPHSDSVYSPKDYRIEGSNSGAFAGEETILFSETGATPRSLGINSAKHLLTNTGSYRYYRMFIATNNGGGEYTGVSELRFYEGTASSTTNTFQQRFLTSGGSATFAPSTIVLKDSGDVDLVNGQVTIEYSTDNGVGWSSSYGLDAFKALGVITATSFWLRYTLVGAATMKSGVIQSTATYASMTATGLDVLVASASIGGITAKGVVPISLTTAERDALTSVPAGPLIFNETTSKLNFYTGSAWEEVAEKDTDNNQTGTTYTLVLADADNKTVWMSNSSANTLTIPTDASVAFAVGTKINVIMEGAGATTILAATGVTLNGTSEGSVLLTRYQGATLSKRASDTWIVTGAV